MFFSYAVVVAGLLLAVRATSVPVRDYLGLRFPRGRELLLGIAVIAVVYFVSPGVDALITYFIASVPDNRFNQPLSGPMLALGLFGTIIIGPLVEEFLFRGFMYRGLQSTLGTVAAVLISGIAFGLIHKLYGYGWDHAAGVAWFGLALGSVRWLTGGITVPFVWHAIGNAGGPSLIVYLVGTWFH